MVCNFSFIASVLAGKNQQILNLAQQMVDILMEKLPKVFSKVFMSEGVMHSARELISLELGDVSERSKSFMEKYCHGGFASVETLGSEDF